MFSEGQWFGPVVWDVQGKSNLNKNAFDVLDRPFAGRNQLNRGPELSEMKPIGELLKRMRKK